MLGTASFITHGRAAQAELRKGGRPPLQARAAKDVKLKDPKDWS